MTVTFGPSFEKALSVLFAEISPRARGILKRRYGLGDGKVWTLEAIGKKENITRERVRQIENDSVVKLRKSESFIKMADFERELLKSVSDRGGLVTEARLISFPEVRIVKDKNSLYFFLDLCKSIIHRKEDQHFHVRWHTEATPVVKVEAAVVGLVRELEKERSTVSKKSLFQMLGDQLTRQGVTGVNEEALLSYVQLSRQIGESPWSEYGHASSPFVRPRGMRESAYVALARAKEPLHFREISSRISAFVGKNVHIQTVHNELIKDPRFVLVGRGLYALREWGYEPGFIRDVVVKLLNEKGPMSREDIIREVMQKRHVKPSTVLINLQNKKLFKNDDRGFYTTVV